MRDSETKIRVAIVDDHPMVRQGLRGFLELADDIVICAEGSSGEDAIRIAKDQDPFIMLMDLVMPGTLDGVAAIREIAAENSDVRIIALTSFQDADKMLGALDAGARGYLQKDVSPDDLLSAIRQVAAGRSVLEPQALLALRAQAGGGNAETPPKLPPNGRTDVPFEPLTPREQEVLEALAKGMSNKEIAAALEITEKTVKVHVSHILDKLGVYDRTQAILAASRMGIIEIR